jgi:hypothetical protein
LARSVGLGSFFAFLVACCLFDVFNPDFGWQLASGRLIWTTGQIPTHDVFSYIAEGKRWIDSHWAYQVLLYGVHAAAGMAGIVLLRTALLIATFALILTTVPRREPWIVDVGVCVLAVFASCGRFVDRPELLSFVFLAATFRLVERLPEHPRISLVGIPLIQILWVNAHGIWPVGYAFLALYLAGDWIQEFVRRRLGLGAAVATGPGRVQAALLVLSGIALLANANGVDGITYPYVLFHELSGKMPVFNQILELFPPLSPDMIGRRNVTAYLLLLAIATLAQLGALRRIRLAHVMPLLAFAYLSSLAIRNIALLAVVAAPITIRNLHVVLDEIAARRTRRPSRASRRAASLAAAGLAAVLAGGSWVLAVSDRLGDWLGQENRVFGLGLSDQYPAEVLPHVRSARGNVFNSPDLGGYLIWQTFPEKQVAVDGRWEIYGEDLESTLRAFSEPATFAGIAARYDVGAVVLGRADFARQMDQWMSRSPGWRATLRTPRAVIYERR